MSDFKPTKEQQERIDEARKALADAIADFDKKWAGMSVDERNAYEEKMKAWIERCTNELGVPTADEKKSGRKP